MTVTGDEDGRVSYLSIGEFAQASGLTPKALRLYDDLGLLPPAQVDAASGYRRYRPDQLAQARLVARLRLVGMPLARIRSVLAASPAGAAAEIHGYWRQVESDHIARRGMVRGLVQELTEKEPTIMTHDPTPRATAAARRGQGARALQQDAAYLGNRLFAVADGFGSTDRAAATVLAAVNSLDAAGDGPSPGDTDPFTALSSAVARAAAALRDDAPESGAEDGSTITAVWLRGRQAYSAHIGDTRLYLVRDGELRQVTRDHTLVAGLVEEGRLSLDEARSHPHRMLLNRAVAPSSPDVEPDLAVTAVEPGDRLVLTTDGVHAVLPADVLERICASEVTPDEAAERVAAAVEDEGAPDNHHIVVVDLA